MEAYMRDQYPFLGLKQPVRMALTRDFLSENGAPSGNELIRVSSELWELPEREFQYTAIVLLEKKRKQAVPEFLSLYEKLIVSKSWWDTVDIIASKLVGQLFRNDPELARRTVPSWISSDNKWLRRTALLFQLTYKERTDAEWLFALIRECAHEKEFFIRKAIGWALREYAKTDAAAVRSFVAGTTLSGLSAREALKHIGSAE
ncbi:DNA alkylation repair protein [Cohnella sp. AR92]|uniref:DNA alkylation repair protein n=1 Tax=Cohnella sp. AR92 TaxID=648716 RepID=UPI003519FF52